MSRSAAPSDPETAVISQIAESLAPTYTHATRWIGSPFAWILDIPSRSRGKVGEQLVEAWAAGKGATVCRSGDSEADRIINGERVEIKFSTLWESGVYAFQQIRDQDYSRIFLLGISPTRVHAWLVPKAVLASGGHLEGLASQHAGAKGSDTRWLRFSADHPPTWLRAYGGSLVQVERLLHPV